MRVARPGEGTGHTTRAVRGAGQRLLDPRRRMPKNTAPPPTATSAAAMPTIRPVLELAPVSARLDSWTAADGALLAEGAGAALSLAESDGLGPAVSAGGEAGSDGVGGGVPEGVPDGVVDGVEVSSALQALAGTDRFGVMSALTSLPFLGVASMWTR